MIRYGLQWHALQDYLAFEETANSSAWGLGGTGVPPANHVFLYAKDKSAVSALYFKNDAGVETEIPSGTIVTGSGVSGRVAFWNGTSSLSSDADMTFAVDTLSITKIIASTAATFSFLTAGRVPYASTAGLLADTDNFAWGNTNACLSLGGSNQDLAAVRLAIITSAGTDPRLMMVNQFSGDANGPQINTHKSRGSLPSTHGLVQANDPLGGVFFRGDDGTTYYQQGARVRGLAGSNWSGSNHESYLELATCPNASTTLTERFRVGPSGQWGIGGATYGTAGQYFRSGGASAAPTWATVDHGAEVGGLTDDDHTQYALLAGRSGGQSLIGGTAAADDLILQATAGVGAGSETIVFKLGSNGAKTVGTFSKASGSTATLELNSADASTQFNLAFSDNGTTKWIIYKTTGNKFSIWDSVNNDDIMTFTATNAVAAAGATVMIDPTISGSNATMIGLKSAPTFTGSGEGPWAFGAVITLTPSANIGAGYANISQCVGNPAAGITITSLVGAYYQTASSVSTGTITNGFAAQFASPSYSGTTKPTTQYGAYIQNQGLAGVTNAHGLSIDAQAGATNNYDMSFGRVDTTAAGAYYGRIPVLYNGLLKYIHVFSA